ncbi:hypothetical protein AACH06_00760 [Ideonella sp. DXS29W]|uniref:Uncharacterized protein n=1 Tax=Ideonella lacteola TaxID=2984193 RepID=A0ABU9BHB2_9BURK
MDPLHLVPPPMLVHEPGEFGLPPPGGHAAAANSAAASQIFASLMAPAMNPSSDEEAGDEE